MEVNELSTQDFRYTMSVEITIEGTPTKKDTVRDAILLQLANAKNAGNIAEATWALTGVVKPEGGKI